MISVLLTDCIVLCCKDGRLSISVHQKMSQRYYSVCFAKTMFEGHVA